MIRTAGECVPSDNASSRIVGQSGSGEVDVVHWESSSEINLRGLNMLRVKKITYLVTVSSRSQE